MMTATKTQARLRMAVGLIVLVGLAALMANPANVFADEYDLRCRPGTDNALAEPRYVNEGDDFSLQVKWNNKRGTTKWVVHWDTNEWSSVEAEEDVDFSPEDNEAHRKSVLYSTFNHTFHTLEDELFEGPERYDAGYAGARLQGGTNAPAKYCTVTIVDDDNLWVTTALLWGDPANGSNFRPGETIRVRLTFNGKVKVSDSGTIGLRFTDSRGWHHDRVARYNESLSSAKRPVFDYVVQAGDPKASRIQVRSGLKSGHFYGVWTNGTVTDVEPLNFPGRSTLRNYQQGEWNDSASHFGVDGLSNLPKITSIDFSSSPSEPWSQSAGLEATDKFRDGSVKDLDSWRGDTYLAGEKIQIKATFDQNVDVTGNVFLGLRIGTEDTWRNAQYESGSGSTELVFAYTVQPSDLDSNGTGFDSGGIDQTYGFLYGWGGGGTINAQDDDLERSPWFAGKRNVSSHKVDGRPYIEGVEITSTPTNNNTYVEEEIIRVALDFSQEVDVEDTPKLFIDLSDSDDEEQIGVWAPYESGTGTDRLVFAYAVGPDDSDSNGIQIPKNGTEESPYLSGGAIKAKDTSVEVDPRFIGIKYAPTHKVDGPSGTLTQGPSVVGFSVTSDPGDDGVYIIGDEIQVTVTFSEDLTITTESDTSEETTAPTLTVTLDEDEVEFALQDSEDSTMVFAHEVKMGEFAPLGISIGEDALDAGDATITDEDENAADLSHDAVDPDEDHRVFGGLTVAENEPVGTSVGNPGELSSPYSISGEHAEWFSVDSDTGDVSTAAELDFESDPVIHLYYTGNEVVENLLIGVIDVDEPGVVTLSAYSHKGGDTLTATFADPDFGVDKVRYQWQVAFYSETWRDISFGRSRSFEVDSDSAVGRLRAKVHYTDVFGEDKVAISEPSNDQIAPTLSSIEVTSDPGEGDTYSEGDVIEILASFSEGMSISGTPQLTLTIGDNTRNASYDRVTGSDVADWLLSEVFFTYTVQAGDVDTDGISIGANPIDLNGGAIQDFALNDATLTVDALGTLEGHKVDSPEVGGL